MDAVIAASEAAASYLKRPSTVILHGIDTARYAPPADRDAAFRATGLPGKYAIGCFGRVRHQKGTDVFVDAMCRLLPKYPDFTAVIVGGVTADQRGFNDGLKKKGGGGGIVGPHPLSRRIADRRCAALVSADSDLRFHLAQRRLRPDAARSDVVGRGAGGGARGRGRQGCGRRRDRISRSDRRRQRRWRMRSKN